MNIPCCTIHGIYSKVWTYFYLHITTGICIFFDSLLFIHSFWGLWYLLIFPVTSLSSGLITHQDLRSIIPVKLQMQITLFNSSNLMSPFNSYKTILKNRILADRIILLFQYITTDEKGSWLVLTQVSLVLSARKVDDKQLLVVWQPASCRTSVVVRTKWLLINICGKLHLMVPFPLLIFRILSTITLRNW